MEVPSNFVEWLQREVKTFADEFSVNDNGHAFAGWALLMCMSLTLRTLSTKPYSKSRRRRT